ncbi:MAG: DoxX family protein [Acidimicrobiales bacterium]
MKSLNRSLGRYASFAPLIIRVILGGLFVLHGIDKFDTGISNVEGFFDSSGVPLAALSAPLTAVLEIVLGIALIIGLFTRLSAVILTLVLFGAIIWVKADGGILGSSELDLAYISGLLALVLLGPGRLSVDEAMQTDETIIDLRVSREESARKPVGVS